MINPTCDKCGSELREFGALAFSPPHSLPDDTPGREVEKYHLCQSCWLEFTRWLEQDSAPGD
ncbi:MAG TPA: hypothetical protein VGJ04_03590 [Pirellulales bacterium]|jgi:hypothetical protein